MMVLLTRPRMPSGVARSMAAISAALPVGASRSGIATGSATSGDGSTTAAARHDPRLGEPDNTRCGSGPAQGQRDSEDRASQSEVDQRGLDDHGSEQLVTPYQVQSLYGLAPQRRTLAGTPGTELAANPAHGPGGKQIRHGVSSERHGPAQPEQETAQRRAYQARRVHSRFGGRPARPAGGGVQDSTQASAGVQVLGCPVGGIDSAAAVVSAAA